MNADDAPSPTTLIDLLNELVEPPEPPPVAMTPETLGWAALAAALALALAWVAWRAWRRWRANAYRRAALAELAAAGDDPATIARDPPPHRARRLATRAGREPDRARLASLPRRDRGRRLHEWPRCGAGGSPLPRLG